MTRLKSQQVLKDEDQNITLEKVCYNPKQILEFSNLYKQKTME